MNKFKFGDLVQVRGKSEKGVVTDKEAWGNALRYFVNFESNDVGWFTADELEAVTHPDTARLDFLIKKGAVEFSSNYICIGEWYVAIPADKRLSNNDSRSAIDAAIKLSE